MLIQTKPEIRVKNCCVFTSFCCCCCCFVLKFLSIWPAMLLGFGSSLKRFLGKIQFKSLIGQLFAVLAYWAIYSIISEYFICVSGAGIACWLERRILQRKVASSNPGRSGGRIFFSSVNFVCWLLFGVRPGHSSKSAVGRLHLNTHTPLIHRSRSGLTMPLSGQSVGIYQETSSHATRQGTLGHNRLNSLSHSGLILA